MTVYVFRHVARNTIGHFEGLLTQWQQSRKIPGWRYVDLFNDDRFNTEETLSPKHFQPEQFQHATAAIFLGGPMNVDEEGRYPFLKPEKALIRWLIEQKKTVLGICLGSQLLASALGAAVQKSPVKEIGWTPIALTLEGQRDPVVSLLGQEGLQFQWHEDMWALPQNATLLGTTDGCAHQIFRLNQHTLGVQYHPEMTLESIESWLQASQSLSTQEKEALLEQSQSVLSNYHQRNQQFLTAFFQQTGIF
jgi:GMP synthase-like glutamine amidotransferase